jgi:hypothetical protein
MQLIFNHRFFPIKVMFYCLGPGGPPKLPATPEAVKDPQATIETAMNDQSRRMALMAGLGLDNTVKTGGQGASFNAIQVKSLLGS